VGVNILLNAENVQDVLAASYLQHNHAISVGRGTMCGVILGKVRLPWGRLALQHFICIRKNIAVIFMFGLSMLARQLPRSADT
jgi:hypothetical protein